MGWKQYLKRNRLIFDLNAGVKSWNTLRQYRTLSSMFSEGKPPIYMYGPAHAGETVRRRLRGRNHNVSPKSKGRLRMLWIGTDYSQDSSGILQALSVFGKVEIFEGRPGTYGSLWPTNKILSVREENSRRLIETVQGLLNRSPLDVVLGQMWGFTFRADALKLVQSMGTVVINLSMDDRHAYRGKRIRGEWTGTSGLIRGLDLVGTAAPECCYWYEAEGCPAIYLPEASAPDFFQPISKNKIHDVCFVGGNYGVRGTLVSRLRSAGIHVTAYGRGWPNGHLPTKNVPMLFSQSRIVLGIGTIGYTKNFHSLKMRDFDGPMSGSLYLTHHNSDLESLYEIGREIDTYKTFDECVEKAHNYLKYPELAKEIGAAGRARALRDHTWEKRFESLFIAAGILEPPLGRG